MVVLNNLYNKTGTKYVDEKYQFKGKRVIIK